jgi:hypothetical protein
MTKFFLIPIALAAIATPALAETAGGTPFSFKADGKTFDVVRVDTPKGAILTGTDSNRNHFRLEVVGRQVSGFYGDGPVSYTIAAPLAPQKKFALK